MVYLLICHFGISYNNNGEAVMNLRIKDLREDRDLRQKDLAAVLQCSQECYSRYENGQRELPLNLLCRLAAFYGTSTDYLLGLTDDPRRYW